MIAKKGNIPVGYYKDEKKTAETFKTFNGVRYAIPGDYAEVDADGSVTMLGRGSVVHQQRRREDLPRRGRGRAQGPPRRFRRVGRRRARRAIRQAASPPSCTAVQGTDPTLAELDTFVRHEIAGYKVPRKPWRVDEIQRTPAGKPDYRWAKDTTEERPADDVARQPCGMQP